MVEIVQDSVSPHMQSVVPAIRLKVKETVSPNSILLKIDGTVFTEDDKFLSGLIAVSIEPSQSSIWIQTLGDYSQQGQNMYTVDLVFTLDKKSLDYIEEVRQKNKKKDVVLKFKINEIILTHNMKVGRYNKLSLPQAGNQEVITSVPIGVHDTGNLNLRIIVSEYPNQLFNYIFQSVPILYTIRSSDWVNDFQGPLGVGKFFIVEVPQLEALEFAPQNLSSDQQKLAERLNKATGILLSMESELNKGEWGNVVSKSRELLELLHKDVKGTIKDLISETTSIDSQKAESLTESIDKLYGYASDLHHVVGKNGITKDVYTGGKEDAYMVYLISTSLVNLLRRKLVRIAAKTVA